MEYAHLPYILSLSVSLSKIGQVVAETKQRQEGHDGPEIAHLSLLTKHAPSSFPVT